MFGLILEETLTIGEQITKYISDNLINGWTSFLVQFLA